MKTRFIYLFFISALLLACSKENQFQNSEGDLVSSYQKEFENESFELSADYQNFDELSSFKISDKITGVLLLEIELDILSSKMVINDYTINEEIIIKDSDKIKDLSNLNFEELINQTSNSRKFWGWQCGLQ